jgi:hypothetical protein
MKLKFFTPELIAAANNWVEQSEDEHRRAEAEFWATVERYYVQLESLKSRVSGPAWNFFRHGYAETGLHDATLLSISIGDAPGGSPVEIPSLAHGRRRAVACVELLNYDRDLHYTFGLRGLKHFSADLFPDVQPGDDIGDLFTYELTETETGELQFGLLFASGATAVFRFERLVFRRRRVKVQG